MKAVIYARFSSDNQREESITAQVRACKEYAENSETAPRNFTLAYGRNYGRSGVKIFIRTPEKGI